MTDRLIVIREYYSTGTRVHFVIFVIFIKINYYIDIDEIP
jgi:hypothetical protein